MVVLPKDATPIDFAYSIHTEVGNTCVGAKVNGRMAQLRTKLHNGDIVEVVTQNGHTPSRDWLTFAKSSRARNKIKHWLNEHQRERAMEIGKKLLDREARKYKVSLSKLTDTDYARAASECGVATASELMAAIGFGKYSSRQVLNKLSPGCTSQISPETEPVQRRSQRAPCRTRSSASTCTAPTLCRWKARTICWSTAPDVAIPFAAKRLSGM